MADWTRRWVEATRGSLGSGRFGSDAAPPRIRIMGRVEVEVEVVVEIEVEVEAGAEIARPHAPATMRRKMQYIGGFEEKREKKRINFFDKLVTRTNSKFCTVDTLSTSRAP